MADFRALCAELLSALESEGYAHWVNGPDEDALCLRARAALADGPAVPEGREVAELVAWLQETGNMIQPSHLAEHQRYQRAAELLQQRHSAPVPVAWMYRGEPDFDGKKWQENWLVTLDRRLAEHGVRLGEPIPLFHAQIAPTPVPVSERLPGPVSDRQQQIEDLAADAVSALRYIEQSHGRLYGIGWDRVYEKADRLLPAHALPLPEVSNG